MTFLTPLIGLIAAAITIPSLVLLYFLKLKRKPMSVSSTLLWKKAIQDLQVNSPFQKLRKNLLLLLQMLLLLVLLFALMRPTLRGSAAAGEQMIIMIDHSASMNANDVKPSRLEQAKRRGLALIDDLQGSATIISFADQARVVHTASSNRAELRAAVRSIQPTDQDTHFAAALGLIDHQLQQAQANGWKLTVYVLSDGRIEQESDLSMPGGRLVFERIGEDSTRPDDSPHNVAVVNLDARRDLQEPQKVSVLARLANYGVSPVSANLTLKLDDQLVRSVRVDLDAATLGDDPQPATQTVRFEFVLADEGLLEVAQDVDDDLPADDRAWLMLSPPRFLSVLVVTRGNAFLQRAVDAMGVHRQVVISPQDYEALDVGQLVGDGRGSGFDVLIFDSYKPAKRPLLPSLFFGTDPGIDGMRLVAADETDDKYQLMLDWRRDHPLLEYVNFTDVVLERPGRFELPEDAVTLATAGPGPVMAMVQRDGVTTVATSFALLDSNWPIQIGFPVFISNAVRYLALGGQDMDTIRYRPGEVVTALTGGDASRVDYDGPIRLGAQVTDRRAVLPILTRAGLYRTSGASGGSGGVLPRYERLPVNMLSVSESNPWPKAQLQVGTVIAQGQSGQIWSQREMWRPLMWAALALLMIEWLVYTRRMHL